ncbi:MAG TPA: tape measure protein, partial [Acinetobacter sp.]|nr:tape measure protein [Acinetobacter sp.]
KDMGKSQQFALEMTSTVTKAIQLGGSSTQEAEGAVTQFIQAMQGGVLRGEEFASVMEGGYGLAEALAKGLGVTTGELRKMAEAGELSAERVLTALGKQKAGIDAQYAEMPLTISNALQKITTSWQILIGEMDQANGASARVAQALSTIADNLGILKAFFDDVASGVGWFSEQLSNIDPSTIDALRATLGQAYETVKNLVSSIAGIAQTAWSAFSSALDAIAPLFNAILGGQGEVSGLATLFNVLRVAMGIVSDAATGLNIGLKLLLSGLQFLAGGIVALQAKVLDFLGFDELAKQSENASDRLFAQAEKNASEAKRIALESKSATVSAIEDIRKTESEKNAERIAENTQMLATLKAQEEKHVADYKVISDERIKLQQQLVDARKAGDQSAIDAALAGLAELDKKEKAYQAESKKISDEKIKAAQDWATAQIEAATKGGVALSDTAKKTIEAGVAAQGLAVEFDKTGKAIVKAIEQEAGTAVVSLDARLAQARKGAADLGLDLDVALNRVSE